MNQAQWLFNQNMVASGLNITKPNIKRFIKPPECVTKMERRKTFWMHQIPKNYKNDKNRVILALCNYIKIIFKTKNTTKNKIFKWAGNGLLFHALRRNTIGAESFHVRVRNGIVCSPLALTTSPPNNL